MKSKLLPLALFFMATAANAAVTVSFVTPNAQGPSTRTGQTLTLDFTVDSSGQVSLDVSGSTTANSSNYNTLDSANVGTVSSSSAFGKTFSFVLTATGFNGAATDYHLTNQGLGIFGLGGNKIDWSNVPGDVSEVGTLSADLTNLAGTTLDISAITVGNETASATARIKDFGGTFANYGTGTAGTISLGGSSFQTAGGASGSTISFEQGTQPVTEATVGYSIRTLTFDVVPEPSAAVLSGIGLIGLLTRRRR